MKHKLYLNVQSFISELVLSTVLYGKYNLIESNIELSAIFPRRFASVDEYLIWATKQVLVNLQRYTNLLTPQTDIQELYHIMDRARANPETVFEVEQTLRAIMPFSLYMDNKDHIYDSYFELIECFLEDLLLFNSFGIRDNSRPASPLRESPKSETLDIVHPPEEISASSEEVDRLGEIQHELLQKLSGQTFDAVEEEPEDDTVREVEPEPEDDIEDEQDEPDPVEGVVVRETEDVEGVVVRETMDEPAQPTVAPVEVESSSSDESSSDESSSDESEKEIETPPTVAAAPVPQRKEFTYRSRTYPYWIPPPPGEDWKESLYEYTKVVRGIGRSFVINVLYHSVTDEEKLNYINDRLISYAIRQYDGWKPRVLSRESYLRFGRNYGVEIPNTLVNGNMIRVVKNWLDTHQLKYFPHTSK